MAYTRKMAGKVPVLKQDLVFDATPTAGSENAVTSGGVAESVAQQSSNIAEAFSASSTYAIGEVVIGPDGKLYQCTTAVETAGEWDPEDWDETSLGDILFTSRGSSNIEVRKSHCKVGDAVYADADGNVHFIAGQSVTAASIPEGWEFVGVVALREGDKALILHKEENNSVKFASCWKWEINGIKYGEENTIQFCQRKSDNTNIDIGDPLTFTPEDMDAAVTAIDTFLRANAGGSSAGAGWNYSWHCEKLPNYLGEDAVIVVADNNVDYRQYNSIINASGTTSGITAKTNMCDFLTAYGSSSMLRNNGGSGFRPGIVYDRLLEYYATNTTIANPSTMVSTSNGSDIVSRTQFEENQYCADLRATYGTFEKYIESIMLKWPSSEGAQASLDGTGKENTYLLDEQSHHLLNGTETKDYTAAAWAAAKSFDAEGLGAGAWYMPDIIEMLDIFGPMKVDGSDPVNAAFEAAGSSARSVALARWSPARYSLYSAWSLSSNGTFNSYAFYGSYRACCVALLDLAP